MGGLPNNVPKKFEYGAIMSFGQKKRAKDWLLYTVLDMILLNPTGNFLYSGFGTQRLSDAIKSELDSGKLFVVLFDVSNFYSSVQGTKWVCEKLKMPEKLALEELFISPNTLLKLGNHLSPPSQDQFLQAARLGLPQGLATSLIVGRTVYEDILTTLFPMYRYFFYGDDGIVFASSKSEAEIIANALWGAFESHPAGPFTLKRCEVCHAADGFDFVMYRYKKKWEGNIHRTPAMNSFKRFCNTGDLARQNC